MDIVNWIITIISGAIGGNIAGKALGDKDLGTIGNSISGIIGGGVGDFALKALGILASAGAAGATTGNFDIGSILANVGVSGVSGAILTAIIGYIKDAMDKK